MASHLTLYLSHEDITDAVERLAQELDQQYQHRELVVVGVIKGAFIFLADLVRQMKTPIRRIELVQAASYGSGTVSPGQVSILDNMPGKALEGRDVLLVEDIIDSGITTDTIIKLLYRHRPASLEVCTLLDKPSRRQTNVTPRFVGFTIPDQFVVGYGLDLDQRYRQLPDIYVVTE